MARQVSFDDIIPSELKAKVVGFSNEQFRLRDDAGELPTIKNRHEAYGVLAEAYVSVKSAASGVKSAIDDALSALPASDAAFNEAADIAYSAALSVAQAAINMSVHAQNISLQLMQRRRDEPLPLVDMAEDGEDMGELLDLDEPDSVPSVPVDFDSDDEYWKKNEEVRDDGE